MSLRVILETVPLLQTFALALSIFNLIAFLWLALTVWLNGDRRTMIARVGVIGLGLSAFFFFVHALLVYRPLSQANGLIPTDFLWHLIWFPALGVPYIWFMIGLHYAALINEGWRRRRPLLLLLSGLLGCGVFLLLLFNQSTFTFVGTLRLLADNDVGNDIQVGVVSPLTLLPVLFLCYVTFCAIGPWFTPARIGRLLRMLWYASMGRMVEHDVLHHQSFADAFWDDKQDVEQLEEPVLSWHLARPGLLVAALLMVGLTTSLGVLGVWSMMRWLTTNHAAPVQSPPTFTVIPTNLLVLDIFATGSVALIILLVGYSIVRHGILIERPLARRGFFEQWRGIVIVATTIAIFIAVLVLLTASSLGGLLFITALATCAYALFTWSSYTAHDRYIALLGPFLRSTNVRHWLNTDRQKTEQSMENLFFHLCKNVLEVQYAQLVVFTGPLRRNFSYRWPDGEEQVNLHVLSMKSMQVAKTEGSEELYQMRATPARIRIVVQGKAIICWVLPIYSEIGLVAMLYLGPRQDGAMFTEEDMDLAHACGQRILDTLRDHEAMQAVAALLRRRIVDVKLLGAQHRRILHDEILPEMHLALLRLEMVRPLAQREGIERAEQGAHTVCEESVECRHMSAAAPALDDAIERITDAHRRLAAMMRSPTPSAPHRLERDGMMHAIHTMIVQDFQQAFDEVAWQVSEEMVSQIDEVVPPALAELTFAAVQEALRNAARHGRGTDVHRRLCLTVQASLHPHLEIIVADDGVGLLSASNTTTGTGGGLLTHSALLAIAGGSLTVKSAEGEGVSVRIMLPDEALR